MTSFLVGKFSMSLMSLRASFTKGGKLGRIKSYILKVAIGKFYLETWFKVTTHYIQMHTVNKELGVRVSKLNVDKLNCREIIFMEK